MRNLLFLFACLPFFAKAQCLSGVYTIGGTTPDFATVTAAVTSLNTNGVCGPVTFNIRNGTYNEQVSIDTIIGASAVNHVTFQSEVMDSSMVTITFAGTSAANYIIRLDGASHITIRHLTLTNISANTYCGVIFLNNNADSVTITNNCLISPVMAAGNQTSSQVYTVNATCDSTVIMNNYMMGGCYGVYGTGIHGINVSGNRFDFQFGTAVNIRTYNAALIADNIISSTSAAPGYEGIFVYGMDDTTKILRNTITSPRDGIVIDQISCTASLPLQISGNMVRTTGAGYTMRLDDDCYSVRITFNTFLSTGSGSVVYTAVDLADIDFRCNILHASGTGYIYWVPMGPILFTSDNNVLYSAAGPIANITGVATTGNLLAWRNIYGLDIASCISQPVYVSGTNLHVAADFAQNLYCPVNYGETTDVDGDNRNTAHAYPGADEFTHTSVNDDAGTLFLRTSQHALCNSSHPVYVTIRNFGNDTLTSVTINWTVNSVAQTPVNWTGSLLYWDTLQVLIGSVTTTDNETFIVHAVTSSPNGGTDPTPANDTLARNTFTVGLTGLYTIGGSSPDFTTVTNAISALNLRGVCGPVNFSIRPGNYNGRNTFRNIYGVSAVNTVRFYSEFNDSSTVVISYTSVVSSGNWVILFDTTSYVTYEDITVVQNGTSYTNCVRYTNGASNNHFLNCEIRSTNAAATEANGAVVLNVDNVYLYEHHNTIRNCLISGGHTGIALRSASGETGNDIINVSFTGQTYASIAMRGQNVMTIDRVRINNPVTGQDRGIWLDQINDSISVTRCYIYGNIRYGIYAFNNHSALDIVNNFISIGSTSASPPMTYGIAILYSSSGFTAGRYLIAFNSVNVFTSSNNANDIALSINSATDTIVSTVLNNILSCGGTGTGLNLNYMMWAGTCDYNDIYATTTGRHNATPYATLAAWQSIGLFDQNSISIIPLFVSASDLHTYQMGLMNAGTAVSGITTDYDNDARAATPFIGADEASLILSADPVTAPSAFSVYPNPAADNVTITIPSLNSQGNVELINTAGECVWTEPLAASSDPRTLNCDLSNFPAGVYCMVVRGDATSCTTRIVIAR